MDMTGLREAENVIKDTFILALLKKEPRIRVYSLFGIDSKPLKYTTELHNFVYFNQHLIELFEKNKEALDILSI